MLAYTETNLARFSACLTEEMEQAVATVHKQFAYRQLAAFRVSLRQHKTHRHDIKICAAMGGAFIFIGDRYLSDYPNDNCSNLPILRTLREIESLLDYDWAYHLDGERLN